MMFRPLFSVIPTKVGTQTFRPACRLKAWVPAYAGMTAFTGCADNGR